MSPATAPIPYLTATKDGVMLNVWLAPRASRDSVVGVYQERLKIALTAPPVEGQANKALIEFLSMLFGIPKREISIVRGTTGRQKTLRLGSITKETALLRVHGALKAWLANPR